jgi:DNA-binding transcriptional regulator of glucitol operon
VNFFRIPRNLAIAFLRAVRIFVRIEANRIEDGTMTADFSAFHELAAKIEAEADSIRRRVGRANAGTSQHIMRAEAAALERSARNIRAILDAQNVREAA